MAQPADPNEFGVYNALILGTGALDTARVALHRLGLFKDYVRGVLGAVSIWGGRAPHPEGTWPKTLLHKPMGVASTEGGRAS